MCKFIRVTQGVTWTHSSIKIIKKKPSFHAKQRFKPFDL